MWWELYWWVIPGSWRKALREVRPGGPGSCSRLLVYLFMDKKNVFCVYLCVCVTPLTSPQIWRVCKSDLSVHKSGKTCDLVIAEAVTSCIRITWCTCKNLRFLGLFPCYHFNSSGLGCNPSPPNFRFLQLLLFWEPALRMTLWGHPYGGHLQWRYSPIKNAVRYTDEHELF